MFEYNPEESFEPTSATKHWYLYTHKTRHTFAAIPLPGLFSTTHFEWQVIGVVGILLLEGTATYWASQQGVIITAILASIFIDFTLAILAHLFHKPILRLRNDIVFSKGEEASAKERRLAFLNRWQRFLFLLILVSAMFKFYWFFSVYRIFDATAIFVLTCYLIGAILHITCTGYAFFTIIFEYKINREHAKYIESGGAEYAHSKTQPLHLPLGQGTFSPLVVGKHRLEANGDNTFSLHTFGVLTDAQLHEMIAKHPEPELKRILATRGLEHQVVILDQGPEGGGK